MFELLSWLANYCFVFILHICKGGSFPKPLSNKQEQEYLRRTKEGDIEARNKLVEHNLRLVAHIIKKYYSTQSDHDDLVSIGTIGLIKAINTFDADKNIKLSSYASRCIENEILMHFRNGRKSSQDISLNEAIDTDKEGNPLTLIDVLSVEENYADELDIKLKSAKLADFLRSELNERERTIIIYRYGLNGEEPLTQREIAQKLGISRSYISRIEKKALTSLRKKFEKTNL
ncbi:MAG: RNA polymerase sporulation sigma factor SigK [Clostridia bacterium]|nr:RNA polymerase sporulation sigma factor SigK [Clostridia bacterium]